MASREGVRAPIPREAALSLVNAMAPLDPAAAGRWELGFSFQPEACGDADVADPCNTTAFQFSDRPAIVEGEPFAVRAGDRCSSLGFPAEDYQGRAERLLLRCQSKQISRELWEGTLAQAAGWPNLFLADSGADTVTTGPSGLIDSLACLEQALADCACGERGVIHATRQVVTHWAALGNSVLRREGGLLLTAHDTIVVSDAGYTGTGPEGQAAGDSVWAYATGPIQVRVSAIEVIPESLSDAIDRETNTVEFVAQRLASATWDGCCRFAAEVDLAACAIGGAS
jgi:hypothetical protein